MYHEYVNNSALPCLLSLSEKIFYSSGTMSRGYLEAMNEILPNPLRLKIKKKFDT